VGYISSFTAFPSCILCFSYSHLPLPLIPFYTLSFSTNPSPLSTILPCPFFPLSPSHLFADPDNNFRMQDVRCIVLLHTYTHPRIYPISGVPQITNRPSNPNVTLSIGATHTITVTYSQVIPPASVEWRKDGLLITDPTVISTSSSETMLTLTNSGPDVRGRYNVTVFNVGGSDTFVYNVKVECKFMHGMGGGGGHHKWFAHSWHGNLAFRATEE